MCADTAPPGPMTEEEHRRQGTGDNPPLDLFSISAVAMDAFRPQSLHQQTLGRSNLTLTREETSKTLNSFIEISKVPIMILMY